MAETPSIFDRARGAVRERPHAPVREQVRTVSQVTKAARELLESRFGRVRFVGEVTDFNAPGSGHWYFTLKDDEAQIHCAMFASDNRHTKFRVDNGQSVVVRARLSVYAAKGVFQAVVDRIAPFGEGQLRAAFEQLRRRLDAEGLFRPERKRSLPRMPGHIGVISSQSGAALGDVLAVLGRRYPCVRVTVLPVSVQGLGAERDITDAFARVERLSDRPDVLVLTRGGGSMEDLAAFNLESVARSIARATVPVVSAIGHEADVTIADYVADRRAPTPSAAAELVTPDGRELLDKVASARGRLLGRLRDRLRTSARLLDAQSRRLVHPQRALEQRMQRVDEVEERLVAAMRGKIERLGTAVVQELRVLEGSAGPQSRIDDLAGQVRRGRTRLVNAVTNAAQRANAAHAAAQRALRAVSPVATLERGYAIVARPDGSRWGRPVATAAELSAGDRVVAHLVDGTAEATVQGVKPARPADSDQRSGAAG